MKTRPEPWPWWKFAPAVAVYVLWGGGWIVLLFVNAWTGLLALAGVVIIILKTSRKDRNPERSLQRPGFWREKDLVPETPVQRKTSAILEVIGWEILIAFAVLSVWLLMR